MKTEEPTEEDYQQMRNTVDAIRKQQSKTASNELLSSPLADGDNEESAGSIRAPLSSPVSELLPCPFCGSSNIRVQDRMFADDDGEHAGVECLDCDGMNRREYWNNRASSERAG